MSHQLHDIAELQALRNAGSVLRIPPGVDVPVTPRVRRIIDSAPFRRLASVSQLGLVSLIYPGATHTRFEHSLGAYRMALLYLQRLAGDNRFAAAVSFELAEEFLLAALLHDVGHWPYCHPLEDIRLPGLEAHEQLARKASESAELKSLIANDWNTTGDAIADMLTGKASSKPEKIIGSLLSSPIDIDKVDYLQRDSLHAGVPYGNHFDQGRLIGSLCLNEAGDGLALTEKGKTAAELLVFARYVMFSEVYWHHAVRAATAMLQRTVWELRDQLSLARMQASTEPEFRDYLFELSATTPVAPLTNGLWGNSRALYKRIAQYSLIESPDIYRQLARRPYVWLIECGNRLAVGLSGVLGRPVAPHEVLVDAPPQGLEVQFNVDLWYPKQDCYRPLGEVSPVVRALAREQFDDFVKRVRIFVAPSVREELKLDAKAIDELVREAADSGD